MKLLFPAMALLAVQALACAGTRKASGSPTAGAQLTAGSPDLRTTDNTGYVDPAGRTRQVSQGTGPAPVGTGSGTPPPNRETPSGGDDEPASTPAGAPMAGPIDRSELITRASRALCDRESFCERVGPGKAFESADACVSEKRERVSSAAAAASCSEIPGDHVAACLTAIRKDPCGEPGVRLPPPPACTARGLCGP
jgi:hypothetical protein